MPTIFTKPLLLGISVGCVIAATPSLQNSAQDSLHTARANFEKGNNDKIKNTSYYHQNHLRYQPAIQDLTVVPSMHAGGDTVASVASEVQQQRSIVVVGSRKEQPIVRRRMLEACPTISKVGATQVEGTDGWNLWSASCAMGSVFAFSSGTVKIKKDPSMPGELVIDRGATSGDNRHFLVYGTLEMEDVTLLGGYSDVSSFFNTYRSYSNNNRISIWPDLFRCCIYIVFLRLLHFLLGSFFVVLNLILNRL